MFTDLIDPVALGLVNSLARPGPNVTGVSVGAVLEARGTELELLFPRPFESAMLRGSAFRLAWRGARG